MESGRLVRRDRGAALSSTDLGAAIWDLNGRRVRTFESPKPYSVAAELGGDGARVATAGKGANVWDADSDSPLSPSSRPRHTWTTSRSARTASAW